MSDQKVSTPVVKLQARDCKEKKTVLSSEQMPIGCHGLLCCWSWWGPMGHAFHLSVHGHATSAHKLSAFRIVHTVSKRVPEVGSPAWDSTGLTTRCQNFVSSGSCFRPLTNPPLSHTHTYPTAVLSYDPCSGYSSIP